MAFSVGALEGVRRINIAQFLDGLRTAKAQATLAAEGAPPWPGSSPPCAGSF